MPVLRLLLLFVLTTSAAAAQPAVSVAASPPSAGSAPTGVSAGRALLVSTGTTAGLAALGALAANGDGEAAAWLVGASAVVGPSAGNAWMGERDDALVGLALRAAGAGAVLYGMQSFSYDAEPSVVYDAALIAGAATYLVGLGYDLGTQVRNGRAARVRVAPAGAGLAVTVGL